MKAPEKGAFWNSLVAVSFSLSFGIWGFAFEAAVILFCANEWYNSFKLLHSSRYPTRPLLSLKPRILTVSQGLRQPRPTHPDLESDAASSPAPLASNAADQHGTSRFLPQINFLSEELCFVPHNRQGRQPGSGPSRETPHWYLKSEFASLSASVPPESSTPPRMLVGKKVEVHSLAPNLLPPLTPFIT